MLPGVSVISCYTSFENLIERQIFNWLVMADHTRS